MKQMIALFGGSLIIYIVIVMLIAVGPAIDLAQTPAGPNVKPLTPLQEQGRDVYAANGCGYCHTQQVRPLPEDKEFGRPSAPGDFAYQTPELLGSERTGPDLTDVGSRRGEAWQYLHLYNPRIVVGWSIMPDFEFLFKVVDDVPDGATVVHVPKKYAPAHGTVIASHKAEALVAYLMSLKQPTIPSYKMNGGMGGPTKAAAPQAAQTTPPSTHSGQNASTGETSAGGYAYDAAEGKSNYATCAACHQASGEGIPGVFPPLKGNPAVDNDDPTLHIHTVLFGAHGTTIDGTTYAGTMPPFQGTFDDTEIANIINYERSSWGNHAKHVTPDQVADVRAKGK